MAIDSGQCRIVGWMAWLVESSSSMADWLAADTSSDRARRLGALRQREGLSRLSAWELREFVGGEVEVTIDHEQGDRDRQRESDMFWRAGRRSK